MAGFTELELKELYGHLDEKGQFIINFDRIRKRHKAHQRTREDELEEGWKQYYKPSGINNEYN